ncbi:endo-polygalacturonase-like [Bacillus rossius redtenbacheri]|uniref:endo-polygalacturonase-like n=1 Tax=Bacillus rossius redtenbacheri TaxID=93214 RepID=UPI002FDEC427
MVNNMQNPHLLHYFTAIVIFTLVEIGLTRDLRNVTEPKIPPICTSLRATGGDETKVIQNALDSCTKGKAVALSTGTFYSGRLEIPSGVGLVVESGVALKAIPNPKLYDKGKHICGTLSNNGGNCYPFISIAGASDSGIYGKGVIDGQGGEKLIGTNTSWWDLILASGGGKHHNNPRLIQINHSENITVYQITLRNSPTNHLTSSNTNGFTVWGVMVEAPESVGNTDGIDPTGSQNVTITRCHVSVGDDNVAISALRNPSQHISVLDSHFHLGNGMAIGSGTRHGVSDVLVSGLTLNHTRNGVTIKSNSVNGGNVSRITYDDVCVYRATKPINLDMHYMNRTGNNVIEFRDISFNHFRVVTKGRLKLNGISTSNQISVKMNDVHITKGSKWITSYVNISGSWSDDAKGLVCGYAGNK